MRTFRSEKELLHKLAKPGTIILIIDTRTSARESFGLQVKIGLAFLKSLKTRYIIAIRIAHELQSSTCVRSKIVGELAADYICLKSLLRVQKDSVTIVN